MVLVVQRDGVLVSGVQVVWTSCTCLYASPIHSINYSAVCQCVDSLGLD